MVPLRGDYVAVAWAAENVSSEAKQLMLLLAGDSPEARGERIDKQLEDAHVDLGRAMIRLRLEGDTQSIVDAYQRVRGNWFQYQWQVVEADRLRDHSEVSKLLQAMEADVETIVTTATADLDASGSQSSDDQKKPPRTAASREDATMRLTMEEATMQDILHGWFEDLDRMIDEAVDAENIELSMRLTSFRRHLPEALEEAMKRAAGDELDQRNG